MNKFDEHTWGPDQLALDGRICIEFEALEASYAGHELTDTLDQWRKSAEGQVLSLRAQIARVSHTARRKHWDDELARLGFVKKRAKVEAEPLSVTGTNAALDVPAEGGTPSGA